MRERLGLYASTERPTVLWADLASGAGALFLPERADQPGETQDQQKAEESKG